MKQHKPDYEFTNMRKGLNILESMSPAGRERAMRYWWSRMQEMNGATDATERHGEQQLDLEERWRVPGGSNGAHASVA